MHKDLLTLSDFSRGEMEGFLTLATRLKADLKAGKPLRKKPLEGRVIALLFEKPSLRTRVTFETGIVQLGGYPCHLPPDSIGIGKRETVEDVAHNLERWVNGLVARVFSHAMLERFAAVSPLPVINALSDDHHPCQALATALTLKEHRGRLQGLEIAYIGDGNNVAASLFQLCARMGIHAVIACPTGYDLPKPVMASLLADAKKSGSRIRVTRDPNDAVKKADLVYTDVWASMGQESETAKRKKIFAPYQVNAALMKHAPKGCLLSHCLPAHRGEEVTSDVLDAPTSVIFDEAENRLHVQKAVMVRLMGK
ncbi:MAG: ornithine carbamoyltransferase [Fibrobacterota bacterium]